MILSLEMKFNPCQTKRQIYTQTEINRYFILLYMDNYPHKIIHSLQVKKTEKFSVLEIIPLKLYDININFDEAHDEWTKNKIKGKNGTYRYK